MVDKKDKCTWIHRYVGDADIYFVFNQSAAAAWLTATFRVSGRPTDSGKTETVAVFSEQAAAAVTLAQDPAWYQESL